MSPGRKETTGFTGTLPYTVKGEEPGLGYKREQAQTSFAEQQLAGYESPGEQRTAEQGWEKQMANLRHQHALELAGFKQGETEEAPFDETGAFNIKHFFNTAAERYPDFSFFQMVDEGEIAKARDVIRNLVVGRYGTDPAKIQAIETALDMWIEGLFKLSENMSPDIKNKPFITVTKNEQWLEDFRNVFNWFKERTPGRSPEEMVYDKARREAIRAEKEKERQGGGQVPQQEPPLVSERPPVSEKPVQSGMSMPTLGYNAEKDFSNVFGYQVPQKTLEKDPLYKLLFDKEKKIKDLFGKTKGIFKRN